MKSKKTISLSISIIICIFGLVACIPTSSLPPMTTTTSDPAAASQHQSCEPILVNTDLGLTMIRLPDNSEIYLAENTEIEVTAAGYCPGITEHLIVLVRGQIAIKAELQEKAWFNVNIPSGFVAQLNDSAVVSYNPESGQFWLDCINGNCSLGSSLQQLNQLACGEGGGLDQNGNFTGPSSIDVSSLEIVYGAWIRPACLAVETSTPREPVAGETPDQAATATTFCATFEGQFPATPCPGSQP